MIGSKELTIEKLNLLDNERIESEISKAKEELFNLRFNKATGQLENHGRFAEVKKDIARLKTVLRERELGIRTAPEPVKKEVKSENKQKDTKITSADGGDKNKKTTVDVPKNEEKTLKKDVKNKKVLPDKKKSVKKDKITKK